MKTREFFDYFIAGVRDFENVDLYRASLYRAKIPGVNLKGANLRGVNLWKANMEGASLEGANLRGASLEGANLKGVSLEGANLEGASLEGTNLEGANLSKTCLDPMIAPNGDVVQFQTINGGQWCVGYRTKSSPVIGGPLYTPGELRTASIFSTSDTWCHPGIFVSPTEKEVFEYVQGGPVVKVIFRPWDCHRAGDKWRVRELIVWEDM